MMKLRIILASRIPLYLLLVGLLSIHACKNKKKLAEISDAEEVNTAITEELANEKETTAIVDDVPENRTTAATSRAVSAKELSKSQMVNSYFDEISSSNDYAKANQSIGQALELFSNPEALVLIIIYENGSEIEYDEPTTVEKYLNYLKDTKSKPATVEEIVTDEAGKIKELVLRKK
jgi:hypothetical protein